MSALADSFRPGTFVEALRFVVDNGAFVWDRTVEHLALSGAGLGVAMAIAVPLGVVLGHLHRGSFFAINVANIGRALPSLAVLGIGFALLGFGFVNLMVALVILAVPPILTNAYVAVDTVDRDVVEAARAMGMRAHQVLLRVEAPLALPLIFAGLRTGAVYVVATATIAAFAGGRGLGEIIANQASYKLAGVVGAALCVSALAFAADGAFAALQRLLVPGGLRHRADNVLTSTTALDPGEVSTYA